MQVKGVLELCSVTSLDIAQRGVGVHNAGIAQILERHEVLVLAQAVQIPF
jgi:hypothetical protein